MNSKIIECPECGYESATLYCYGSEYAGMWECDNCGLSDTHEHGNFELETITIDGIRNGEPYQYEDEVYVCGGDDGCGVIVDNVEPSDDEEDE